MYIGAKVQFQVSVKNCEHKFLRLLLHDIPQFSLINPLSALRMDTPSFSQQQVSPSSLSYNLLPSLS